MPTPAPGLQGSRTGAWSACCCQRWTEGKRGHAQFRLSWSTFLAGISGKIHPCGFSSSDAGAAALGCVSTKNTQALGLCQSLCPGRQAWCLPGMLQVGRESGGDPTGGVMVIATQSQTCGKTTQTHPLRIFPHLEHSSVTGESVGGPENPQCQPSVTYGAAKPSRGSGPCWTPEHSGPEDPSSPQPAPHPCQWPRAGGLCWD